jgi:FkbM family methyltransferase
MFHRSFRLVLILTISLLLGVIAALVVARRVNVQSREDPNALPRGARYLAAAYGPDRYSQFAEEWIIRDFFQDKRDGVFVDAGANHYRDSSTTYYLEKNLGWSGLAIEPLSQFEADYKTHRPRTTFLPFFVSDVSDETAKMYVLDAHTVVSSADRKFTERTGANPREVTVPTITLNDLLPKHGLEKIDLLSMDIELSEPKALAGFDIKRFRPELVCIEAHSEVRQQILDYFARNGYVIVGKYLPADEHNLYFMPLR